MASLNIMVLIEIEGFNEMYDTVAKYNKSNLNTEFIAKVEPREQKSMHSILDSGVVTCPVIWIPSNKFVDRRWETNCIELLKLKVRKFT
jgi:hypothetical protein